MGVSPWIPDLDGPIFAASNEPLAFVMKRDGGDVGSVALERNQLRRTNMRGKGLWESEIGWEAYGSGRGASNLINIDLFVNCCREETFTGRSGGEHSMGRFNRRVRLTLVKWPDDSLAIHKSPRAAWGGEREGDLTPDSPERVIVLEQIPDQASQKRISWSYEPVTRMTDMSCAA